MKKILFMVVLAGAFAWPEWIGTKQDLVNLMSIPQHRERALKELQTIYNTDDAKAVQVLSGSEESKDLVTKEIDNPKPLYKRYGFTSKDEVGQLLSKEGVDVREVVPK